VTPRAHPRVPGHPRNRLQRVEIADRHVVRAVRPHAESAQRETGETRAVLQHHAEVLDRHRLRLRRAVDVHELREEVADAVLLEELPCFSRCHGLPLCVAYVGCREISGQEADAHRPAAEPGSDVRERLEQIGTERAVAPQAPAREIADVPAQHGHADADHRRERDDAHRRIVGGEGHGAGFREQRWRGGAGDRERAVLTGDRIHAGREFAQRIRARCDDTGRPRVLDEEFRSAEPRNESAIGRRQPAVRCLRHGDPETREPFGGTRPLEARAQQRGDIGDAERRGGLGELATHTTRRVHPGVTTPLRVEATQRGVERTRADGGHLVSPPAVAGHRRGRRTAAARRGRRPSRRRRRGSRASCPRRSCRAQRRRGPRDAPAMR
jgi:hypothetical protein